MNTKHEGNAVNAGLCGATIDVALTGDGNPNHVLISVDSECQMQLTFEEARQLAIRMITAANQAEVQCMLKARQRNLTLATRRAPKGGGFLRVFAR
jgi:hypothetical protein